MVVGIVGGGPVGLLLANFLQKGKVPFKLFEKHSSLRGKINRASLCSYYKLQVN